MLDQLRAVSAKLGKNPLLVQGAGGNTSLKEGDIMHIKASGTWLSNAEKGDIFVSVSHKKIRHNINSGLDDPLKGSALDRSLLRPSIETTLHALMPHAAVLHTHPVELISLLVLSDAQQILKELLRGMNWAWVDYSRPGIDLTRKVSQVLNTKQVDILVLGNHGLVVGGNDCIQASKLIDEVLFRCKRHLRKFKAPLQSMLTSYARKIGMKPVENDIVHALAMDESANNYCQSESTVLYPDQAVFLGPVLNCLDAEDYESINISDIHQGYVIIKGVGVFVAKHPKSGVEEMLACHAEILMRIPIGEKLRYLSKRNVCDLLDWEPEKYRQTLGK